MFSICCCEYSDTRTKKQGFSGMRKLVVLCLLIRDGDKSRTFFFYRANIGSRNSSVLFFFLFFEGNSARLLIENLFRGANIGPGAVINCAFFGRNETAVFLYVAV